MNIVWENIKRFFIKLDEHHISEYTAQCAYYTILSFIPFIMLIVTLIQYTGISQNTLNAVIQKLIPETMSDTTMGIIQEVYSKSIRYCIYFSNICFMVSQKRFLCIIKRIT